jgi:predicted AlkP superfamily phosphohydrolase/phosphomutase
MKVRGICRFLLLESSPHVKLYMTPLQIDPARPAIPISHPMTYSVYLAKAQGPFATLGVAEDTSSLNEGVIGEEAFLEQALSIHEERERMFFDALEKNPDGAVVCVFDLADRVQHMFLRYLDGSHPGVKGKGDEGKGDIVRETYRKMDGLLGRVVEEIDDGTTLMVLSDHGFKSFRREVNLNAWLRNEGFLAVKEGGEDADMLQGVDWSRTKAYAVGFGGIYLNLRGRESSGIVDPGGAAEALKADIARRLDSLKDPADGEDAVREVFDRDAVYSGPYLSQAPDLIVGFRAGYRAAWRSVTGGVGGGVFEDNLRPWGGDHNMHPAEVPGIFFCNRKVDRENLRIEDIAPTVLDLFGVPVPGNMDGRPIALDGAAGGGGEGLS